MLNIERISRVGDFLTQFDRWAVHEMILTPEKIKWLWDEVQKYPTLFSDLTRGDVEAFTSNVLSGNSFWVEVYDPEKLVGIMYLKDLDMVVDANVHIMFFDRKLREKSALCRHMIRWMFDKFRLHRVSTQMPSIYHATVHLTRLIGFKHEGTTREMLLIGGKWVDVLHFGLLATEMD